MSQFTFGNIDETAVDGYTLADYLEQFEAAINSGHSGSTAPPYATQGTIWRNTAATPHLICIYDNSNWVVMGQLNPTTHVFRPWVNGAPVTDLAALAVGNGLLSSGGNLVVKPDSGIAVSSGGVRLNMGLTPGAYTNINVTVDSNGNISAVSNGGVQLPVGFNYWQPSTVVPSGFIHLNGQTLSRSGTYAALYAYANASGNMAVDAADFTNNPGKFGIGDGVSTFQAPDTRGLFMRSWDGGAGRDLNDPGRAIGTYQRDNLREHFHGGFYWGPQSGSGPGGLRIPSAGPVNPASASQAQYINGPGAETGKAETVPQNITWMHVMKY